MAAGQFSTYRVCRGRFRIGKGSRPITGQTIPRFSNWALLLLASVAFASAAAEAGTAAGGKGHSAVALPDGSVWVWGAIGDRQLDDTEVVSSPVPVPVFGLANVVALASGAAHLLALTSDGDVWAWGANDSGQVGDGSNKDCRSPVLVLRNAVGIDASADFSVAWKIDGSLWGWGAIVPDEDGSEKAGRSSTPKLISRNSEGLRPSLPAIVLPDAVTVAAGGGHSLARLVDGTVWTWGRNEWGQLGDGTHIGRSQPGPLVLERIVEIAAGFDHSLAVTDEGVVWTWGCNTAGQLGDGTTESSAVPIAISGPGFKWKAGRPVLDPPGGTYDTKQDVTITSATGDASILYSTSPEGVPATETSSGGTARVDETSTLLARAFAPDRTPSDVTIADYLFRLPAVRFEPGGGVYRDPQVVHLAGPDGASVRYTSDGNTPDQASTLYTAPIVIDETTVLQARAFRPGWQPSPVSAARYRFGAAIAGSKPTAESAAKADDTIFSDGFETGDTSRWSATVKPPDPPLISPEAGVYQSNVTVSIDCAGGGTAHYTFDGTDPAEGSPVYDQPFTLTEPTIVKAGCFQAPGGMSSIATSVFTLTVPTPSLSPSGWTYNVPKIVTVTCPLAGAEIHYTMNGLEPTLVDPIVASGGTLVVDFSTTVKAKAWKTSWAASATRSETYTLRVGAPGLAPGNGVYDDAQEVTVSSVTPGVSWNYRLDGTAPTATDAVVEPDGTIVIDKTASLTVKGRRTGWLDSAVASASYFITPDTVATPSFDPGPGSYVEAQTVSIASATPGAVIRYTTDGSQPGPASALYVGPITLDATVTLKVKAFAEGLVASDTAGGLYEIGDPSLVATPTFDPPPGRFAAGPEVAITTATPDATVRFTTNGADPLADDPEIVPGEKIGLDRAAVLKAKAWKTGMSESGVRSGFYVVTGDVAAGGGFVIGLMADGTVVAWGGNSNGELGNGSTSNSSIPVVASGLDNVVAIDAGESHSVALRSGGTVFCWGLNTDGQLGNGTTDRSLVPQQVPGLSGVVAIAAGDHHTLAVKSDGTVWVWGENDYWQLGDGTTTTRTSPVQITVPAHVVAVAGGRYHSLALTSDGEVWGWGWNNNGQVGDGTTTVRSTPVLVAGLTGVTRIAAGQWFSLALQTDGLEAGTLWGWGDNGYGQLATGDTGQRTLPVQILDGVTDMGAALQHVLAIRQDGSLWAWGAGGGLYGRLGDGTRVNRFVPVQIWGLRDVVAVDGGGSYSVALRADGTVFTWGYNIGSTYSDTPVPNPDLNLVDNSWLTDDIDGDGLSGWAESQYTCDPLVFDTNGDGLGDGASVNVGLSCSNPDLDGDGLTNTDELGFGTSPWDADSDDDGSIDGADCAPLDPTRWECPVDPSDTTPPTITILEPADATPLP